MVSIPNENVKKSNNVVATIFSPKLVALVVLMLQTTATVLLMRRSREQSHYFATTAVVMSEIVKCIVAFLLLTRQQSVKSIIQDTFLDKRDFLIMILPGLLYTIQNNLLFISLSNLSGAVYQLTYQLKVLTTGLLSVIFLGRVLSGNKWGSLVLLTLGVGLIQMEGDSNKPAEGSTFIGIIAVLAACFTSAMAGVYLEKTIKASSKSVMIRTIQLGAWGILLGSIGAYQRDGVAIREKGFFFDYNSLVWLVIFLQALGGIVIGMVMKYADNILKCFANASSIVITILIEGGNGLGFIPGTSLVILATSMYGMDASPLDVLSGAKPLMSKLLSKIRPSLE